MNNSRFSNFTKRIRRRFCASWIAPLFLLLALPPEVQAQFNYVVTNGTVTITGYTGPGGAVTIPDTIAGLPVTTIGANAFYQCRTLTRVTIPNTVTGIGASAFLQCGGLTNVTIGDNVASIGAQAFIGCFSLTTVTIPNSVTGIGDLAFGECTGLTAITVDALNSFYCSVDGVLFDKIQTTLIACPGGKPGNYTIPSSVTGLGNGAFYYCRSLTTVTIPNTVISIGDYAFCYCDLLATATIPSSVTNIGYSAFNMCSRLNSITIPEGVTTIAEATFYGCGSLTSVAIPNSVTSIADLAFYWCYNLTNVTISDRVTSIGASAFRQSALTRVTIPSGVTNIGVAAFEQCTRLTVVAIPNSVTSIACLTFEGCTGLSSVTIGNSVTNIGCGAFLGCSSLTSVMISDRVTNLEDQAFGNCIRLGNVYFKGNAPSVVSSVFSGDNATVYYLPGTTGWGATLGGLPTTPWPPPVIQTPPQTQIVEAGSVVEFPVQTRSPGNLVLGYQWFFNRTSCLRCTNSELQLTNVQFSQAGTYSVIVTNAAGSVTSPPALLSVIAPVERRMVPGLNLTGQPGTILNLDFTAALAPAPLWTTFDHVPLVAASRWYFDLSSPLPPQRFYRAWQYTPGTSPVLSLNFVPALTLTGTIGSSERVDYINQFGPIDAWVTNLATVTLTNTSQLYFDTSVIGQPPRLWRIVPVP